MSVFRKVALKRLSSPERLDELLRLTEPCGWLALLSLGLLVLAGLVWGFAGTISVEAAASGMLFRPDGLAHCVAPAAGRVERICVAAGDLVRKGQIVARLRPAALPRQIDEARARRKPLANEYENLRRFVNLERRYVALQKRTIAGLERERRVPKEDGAAQFTGDPTTQGTQGRTEPHLAGTKTRAADFLLEMNRLEFERMRLEETFERRIRALRSELRSLDLEIGNLTNPTEVEVLAPASGRIVDLAVHDGDMVSPGTAILSTEGSSEAPTAVLFVAASESKKLRPGMAVRLLPANIQQEKHGFLLGSVRLVAEYASTLPAMERLLGDTELVRELVGRDAMIRVDVALVEERQSASGYRWSFSTGPPVRIANRIRASGWIVMAQVRPISLLFSKAASAFGS